MYRRGGWRIPERSAVGRMERRKAEKREILKYHSLQLRIFVVVVWMIWSRMRNSVVKKMSEKMSGAVEIRNVCCLLLVV